MPHFLSQEELQRTAPAETAFASPVPTQIVSNGEFNPLPQTREQKRVEAASRILPSASHPFMAWIGDTSSPARRAWPRRSSP
jgi:hypothetical protein